MTSADIAGWISAITGVISLIVAIAAYVKSTRTATKLEAVERQLAVTQTVMHMPFMTTGGGGGGGGGPGGGAGGASGSINYQPNQSSSVSQG